MLRGGRRLTQWVRVSQQAHRRSVHRQAQAVQALQRALAGAVVSRNDLLSLVSAFRADDQLELLDGEDDDERRIRLQQSSEETKHRECIESQLQHAESVVQRFAKFCSLDPEEMRKHLLPFARKELMQVVAMRALSSESGSVTNITSEDCFFKCARAAGVNEDEALMALVTPTVAGVLAQASHLANALQIDDEAVEQKLVLFKEQLPHLYDAADAAAMRFFDALVHEASLDLERPFHRQSEGTQRAAVLYLQSAIAASASTPRVDLPINVLGTALAALDRHVVSLYHEDGTVPYAERRQCQRLVFRAAMRTSVRARQHQEKGAITSMSMTDAPVALAVLPQLQQRALVSLGEKIRETLQARQALLAAAFEVARAHVRLHRERAQQQAVEAAGASSEEDTSALFDDLGDTGTVTLQAEHALQQTQQTERADTDLVPGIAVAALEDMLARAVQLPSDVFASMLRMTCDTNTSHMTRHTELSDDGTTEIAVQHLHSAFREFGVPTAAVVLADHRDRARLDLDIDVDSRLGCFSANQRELDVDSMPGYVSDAAIARAFDGTMAVDTLFGGRVKGMARFNSGLLNVNMLMLLHDDGPEYLNNAVAARLDALQQAYEKDLDRKRHDLVVSGQWADTMHKKATSALRAKGDEIRLLVERTVLDAPHADISRGLEQARRRVTAENTTPLQALFSLRLAAQVCDHRFRDLSATGPQRSWVQAMRNLTADAERALEAAEGRLCRVITQTWNPNRKDIPLRKALLLAGEKEEEVDMLMVSSAMEDVINSLRARGLVTHMEDITTQVDPDAEGEGNDAAANDHLHFVLHLNETAPREAFIDAAEYATQQVQERRKEAEKRREAKRANRLRKKKRSKERRKLMAQRVLQPHQGLRHTDVYGTGDTAHKLVLNATDIQVTSGPKQSTQSRRPPVAATSEAELAAAGQADAAVDAFLRQFGSPE